MTKRLKQRGIFGLFFLNLAVIVYFWWQGSYSSFTDLPGTLLALGKLSGLLAVLCALSQFMMMGRTKWIEELFGLDKISRVHRLNGYLTFIFIIIHPILITYSYALSGKISVVSQFVSFLSTEDDFLKAALAVVLFIVIVASSVYIVRKRVKYEWWYAIHLINYLAIVLAWGHQLESGSDFAASPLFVPYWYALYIFVFGNVLIFRFLRPMYLLYRHRFYIHDVKEELHGVHSVYISGNHMDEFKIKPGQFMIMRFLSPGYWLEAHPFSLSWIPQKGMLRITPKIAGDFTRKISSLKKNTLVMIDGPFGTFTADAAGSHTVLLIAGGIGITPIRSLAEQLAKQGKDIVVIYSNKVLKDVVFKKELDQLSNKYAFPIHYILTQEKQYKQSGGRLNAEVIKKMVPDVKMRDVYVCGPVGMINGVRHALSMVGVPANKIHFEKFSMT